MYEFLSALILQYLFEVSLQGMMILVSDFKALLTEWKLMLVIIEVILILSFKMFWFNRTLLPVTFHLIVSEVRKRNFLTVTSPMQLNN